MSTPEGPAPVPPPTAEPPARGHAPVRRRPRGRTTLIIAAAALLGIAGGAAVGYGIQAERPPTPPAALSQPGLGYPVKPAARAPAPLPASEDRQVRTDGDLRKLLVDRPEGAQKTLVDELGLDDGWEPLEQYAERYKNPQHMFQALAEGGLRRVASTAWEQGEHRKTAIQLIQFRAGDRLGASEHFDGQMQYMPWGGRGAGNSGHAIKGSREGRYFLYPVQRKEGYLPLYEARALAVRGDIALNVSITDTVPIREKDIRTLAERQLERL
ncbi:hypothetical protein ACIODW_19040 [Streptomyces sp. NPDC087897]|uniref:hypothetical protein n=1 Tax=Streptomyces sp. NPDC087897 TaxID=3365817 RepID=UPI003803EC53